MSQQNWILVVLVKRTKQNLPETLRCQSFSISHRIRKHEASQPSNLENYHHIDITELTTTANTAPFGRECNVASCCLFWCCPSFFTLHSSQIHDVDRLWSRQNSLCMLANHTAPCYDVWEINLIVVKKKKNVYVRPSKGKCGQSPINSHMADTNYYKEAFKSGW